MRRLHSHKFGDLRSDGYRYLGVFHDKHTKREQWASPKVWVRRRFHSLVCTTRKRAVRNALPFNLTANYLESIFPADGLCPILLTPMSWGDNAGRDSSPSLDRRVPELGYVEGNVAFVSNRINQLKGSCTLAELERLVAHIKGQLT